jgi:hypothetical protein
VDVASCGQQRVDEVRSDEAGTAGNEGRGHQTPW